MQQSDQSDKRNSSSAGSVFGQDFKQQFSFVFCWSESGRIRIEQFPEFRFQKSDQKGEIFWQKDGWEAGKIVVEHG